MKRVEECVVKRRPCTPEEFVFVNIGGSGVETPWHGVMMSNKRCKHSKEEELRSIRVIPR